MLNFYKKLPLLILSGSLTLGLSSVANAGLMMGWMSAHKKLDCPTTCRTSRLTPFPLFAGINKNNKPISICTTKYKKSGEWLIGYNRWEQKFCTFAVDGKEFHSKIYYCLCHNDTGMQPLR